MHGFQTAMHILQPHNLPFKCGVRKAGPGFCNTPNLQGFSKLARCALLFGVVGETEASLYIDVGTTIYKVYG